MTETLLTIAREAENFRDALRECRCHARDCMYIELMGKFPAGCCKVASMLFARHLVECHLADANELWVVVNGTDTNGVTHAWVELDGIATIDISGDQFEESLPLICETPSKQHYARFNSTNRGSYHNVMDLHQDYRADFDKYYNRVRMHLACM